MKLDAPLSAARESPAPPVRPAVVGREAELATIASLLDRRIRGPVGVLLEGAAGIGKTTLWYVGVDIAREGSRRVLTCRPAAQEAALPFSALGDVLEPVLDADLSLLPEPQRVALEVALLRAAPDAPTDQLAVSRAALALLRGQPGQTTVLAIDDVQWLDASSAQALAFVLRRLGDTPVRVLLARRDGLEEPLPLGLERSFPVQRIHVGPLTIAGLDRLIVERLRRQLPRPLLVQLHRTAGGNPYFALEMIRALERRVTPLEPGAELPVPKTIAALLHERIRGLSNSGREALLFAALSARPTATLLEKLTGTGSGIEEALSAGILEHDGDRLRFTHPLLASVAADDLSEAERRETHLQLAAAGEDREERARHLALGTLSPDRRVSTELDAAAEIAARRGAPSAAAQLAEHAVRLTPSDRPHDVRRRLSIAAEHHYAAGDQERSRSILETLADELPPGPERARVLALLSQRVQSQLEGLELCRRALSEAGEDVLLQADLHFYCAAGARRAASIPEAEQHARLAVRLAAEAGDDARRARALAMLGHVQTMKGHSHGLESLERAVELESAVGAASLHFRPSFLLGITLIYLGELDRARPLIREQLERANEQGDEVMRGVALSTLAELELRAGDWSQAYRCASEGASLQEQAAPLQDQAHHVLRAARVTAHMGRVDEARAVATRLLELAPVHGDRAAEISARRDLGFVELSLGNSAETVAVLEPAVRLLIEMQVGLQSAYPLLHDYVEALVIVGDLDEAEQANALLAPGDRPWHAVVGARGRALISAARGDYAEAQNAIGSALEGHERLQEPFELGRTLLVQGSIERRAKRRADARQTLTRALELFDSLGAPLWAEKAAAELARIPGRTRGTSELSETERRVGKLVAEGLSNKEVAAKLFVTVRTVEANLSKVYAKLGIRSRTELGRRL